MLMAYSRWPPPVRRHVVRRWPMRLSAALFVRNQCRAIVMPGAFAGGLVVSPALATMRRLWRPLHQAELPSVLLKFAAKSMRLPVSVQ